MCDKLTRFSAATLALLLSACASAPRATVPASAPVATGATGATEWLDPSPHTSRLVKVAEGVQLELLDWGGQGPPLIFLAGLGNSAHIFDDFAPPFRDRFHVYGVTRRGFGASSQPKTGYDVATLSADLLGVLREIGIKRASFVGHSIAGEELNWLAVHEPERVEKLVYLDAALDRVALREAGKKSPEAPRKPDQDPTDQDKASVAAFGAYVERTAGVRMPEADLRATCIFDAAGRYVRDRTPDETASRIMDGVLQPDFAHIAAPALAIYAVAEPTQTPWSPSASSAWSALSEVDREKVKTLFAYYGSVLARERDRFRREVIHGQVVEIPNANHYVFLSHRALVLEKMRAFLGP